MAHDEALAQRVRDLLAGQAGLEEKKMFGGATFMLQGNMALGVSSQGFIVRVGPDNYDAALANSNTRVRELGGRPMKGWVFVDEGGYKSDDDLKHWVNQARDFTMTLPPKKKK